MISTYDSWKTRFPDHQFGVCARCHESEEDHDTVYAFDEDKRVCPSDRELAAELEALWTAIEDELFDEGLNDLLCDAVDELPVYEERERDYE